MDFLIKINKFMCKLLKVRLDKLNIWCKIERQLFCAKYITLSKILVAGHTYGTN